MKNKKYLYYRSKALTGILFILIVAFSIACKSPKETETASVALEKVSKEERVTRIIRSGIDYNTISSNLKFTLSRDKSKDLSVDAQLRILKNEAIQLSLRVPILGSEAFKVLITPDKVVIIDRINKQYMEESIKNVKSRAPFEFDYYTLEALLSNRLFIAGKKEVTLRDFNSFRMMESDYDVKITNTDKQNIQYDFTSNYTNRIQKTQIRQQKLQANLFFEYTDWGITSDKKDFPMSMKVTLAIPEKEYKVNMTFKSVDINSNFTVDYKIPGKYKQITLQQVMNLIKKLL